MKKWIPMITVFCLLFSLTACGAGSGTNGNTEHSSTQSQIETPSSEPVNMPDTSVAESAGESPAAEEPTEEPASAGEPAGEPASAEGHIGEPVSTAEPLEEPDSAAGTVDKPAPIAEPTEEAAKTLVVYFSATGNTKAVAEEIGRLTGADLYEIVPAVPYTNEDLNYNDNNCRANQEMNDASARPAIGSEAIDISSYDTVFIGHPIWWGTTPRIINTFLDTYDLSGKTVLPFCTSGSSGISQAVSVIRSAEPDADVRDGLRAIGANDSSIENWIANNGIV